ncbi:MAG TPA: type II secretion system protein [Nitrospiria bacterium]|nr:type II secretion system protein [Nitrospiria bacterium]
MRKRAATNEQGVTLIETVIVIIVLGLSLAVLIPSTVSTQHSATPVLTQQAAALAQEKLEQIFADRLDQTTPRGFTYATTPGNYPAENPIGGVTGFSRSVAITCVTTANLNAAGSAPSPSCAASAGRTDYARVTVTVTNGAIGSVTAATLLTNY